MKKLIAMMLMLASVFFIACDDDEEDKKPLTPAEAKVEITQSISDMSTHIDALNNAEGIEAMDVMVNLPDPFTTKKSTAKSSVIPNMKRFLLPLDPNKTKNAFEVLSEGFDFDTYLGVYTYHHTPFPYWEIVPGGHEIVINFPSDSTNMTVNDAKITIYNYEEVLITEIDGIYTDTYYNPTKIEADLYVGGTKLVDIDMSATWITRSDDAGEPTDLDISVYLYPFTFTGTFNHSGNSADIEFTINYEGSRIFGIGLDATFENADMEDPLTIGGYIQFLSVKLEADVDVQGLIVIFEGVEDGTITYADDEEMLAAINAEIDAAVYVDGAKAADIELALNTTAGEDDLPIDILFIYSDGSSESALPYFEDFALELEDFFDSFDEIYGDW